MIISELTIKTELYRILNKDSLKALLNGGLIYKEARPTNSDKNDIVINTNFLKNNRQTGVYSGVANVNIYSKALNNGACDSVFLELVFNEVVNIFENLVKTGDGAYTYNNLNFDLGETGTINELGKNEWFYLNIPLNINDNNQ